MKNCTTGRASSDDSRTTLVRVGMMVVIATMVAGVVWFGAHTRADDSGTPDTSDTFGTADVNSSDHSVANASVEKVAPDSAPVGGVVIPTAANRVDGYPIGFPATDLGAVALQVEVAKAQVGFDYVQAVTVAGLYADPEDKAVFEDRARGAVALRRQQAGVSKVGAVPAPASYALTPLAYTLEQLDTDDDDDDDDGAYYAVNLLSYVTLTTADGTVKDSLYAGTQLVRWLEVDGVSDWRLVQGSEADIEHLVSVGQPKAVAPGTPEYNEAGWVLINGAPQ